MKCSRFNCDAAVCGDCFEALIDYCHQNFKEMPSCPNVSCRGEYKFASVCEFAPGKKDLFIEIVQERFNGIDREKEETKLNKKLAKLETVEFLRREVKKRLERHPPAIAETIKLGGMTKQLNAILLKNEKKRVAFIQRLRCPVFSCKGFLTLIRDETMCIKCEVKICEECGEIKLGTNHECERDNIESAKMLKNIARCPKCNVPATKGDGCNFITCPYCNTNFHCATGEQTSHGGHNKGRLLVVEHENLEDLSDDPELKILLKEIQRSEPRVSGSKHPGKKHDSLLEMKNYHFLVTSIHFSRSKGELTRDLLERALAAL